MKGDFTRFTHDPTKRYTGVLKQQGRVDLDADWNEQVAIQAYLGRLETRDVIGSCGVPKERRGFQLGTFKVGDELDLIIFSGRIYVDGLLCKLESTPVSITGLPADNQVQVAVWNPDGRDFQIGQWVSIDLEGDLPFGFRIIGVDPGEKVLTLELVNGGVELGYSPETQLRRITTYTTQPDYPNPPELEPAKGRTDLVYLDVWQRHVTAIEDPDIREVALGGPDTTTRVKTVWQVKVQEDVENVSCEDRITGWPPPPSEARLSTGVIPTPAAEHPCLIAPGGGYRGLENRLYRVEIHKGRDSEAGPTFKWSRDNGSVVFAIEEFVPGEPNKVKVKRLGRDQVLTLRAGDWVEVLGDESELRGEPGTLAQIVPDGIDEARRILTFGDDVSAHSGERSPKVRRWDQSGASSTGAIPVEEDVWLELEDGVQIRFKPGGTYRTGDYWAFAARTATGAVEELVEAPPHGIEHRYCRLALITWVEGDRHEIEHCSPTFPPLDRHHG